MSLRSAPPIPLSCLLELGRGAPAGQGLGGPQRRAGSQAEMREEGRNWGEPWGIQVDPWGETGRVRRRVTQKGDLWEEERGGSQGTQDQTHLGGRFGGPGEGHRGLEGSEGGAGSWCPGGRSVLTVRAEEAAALRGGGGTALRRGLWL